MTFSIVACSEDGQSWGVAVASKFLAVGSVVPAAAVGHGAVATQATANVRWKREALDLLGQGLPAQDVLSRLVAGDANKDDRQIGIVGRDGGAATFTGARCMDWAGGIAADGVAIQGNILVGSDVVGQMKAAWDGSRGQALAHRLITALAAGDEAGGDRRGRQSAALYVVRHAAGYGGMDDIAADLRVDDHPDPVTELSRLLNLNDFYLTAPREDDKVAVDDDLRRELDARARELGHDNFLAWVGAGNYEMRVADDASWVDRSVLEMLRGS